MGKREMGGNVTSLSIYPCIVLTFGSILIIFYIFKNKINKNGKGVK